ncbi:MAG: response regulator [Patescibacteria group bacterium]
MNTPACILICEDEPLIQSVYHKYLAQQGYEILTANNGKIGLKIAKEKHPDLILLDILMPVMDGLTTLRELRKDAWGKNANVLVLTNLSMADDQQYTKNYGVKGFLIKADHSLKQVGEIIKTVLA